MTYVLPILALGDAVFALFQDPELTTLTPGGIQSDVTTDAHEYPFLWFELFHDRNYGGLGTQPGQGSMPGVTLRLHVFQGNYGTMRDAYIVMARAIDLLYTVPLVVDGYTVCGGGPMPEIETIPLHFEVLNDVPVKELVCNVDLIVEEGPQVVVPSWVQSGFLQP